MERMKELMPLALDKETIARLDEAQLLAIAGGIADDADQLAITSCGSAGGSCIGGTTCVKGNSC